jgi:hypothetical protein
MKSSSPPPEVPNSLHHSIEELAKPLGIENKGDCSIPDETQEEGFRGKILRIPEKVKKIYGK